MDDTTHALKGSTGREADANAYPGNELVTVSDWVVGYSDGTLSVCCTVKPKDSSNAVSSLYVSAYSARGKRVQYCSSNSSLNGMNAPHGTWMSGFASTQLFDPAVNGHTSTSVICGFVKTDMGSKNFYIKRDFDVTDASFQSEKRHS
ncbi:hypothetical protein JQX13_13180 [Archangium violaceum]|uniref:hypothetical protein n=1 Tax=Archangium violaceum TaxID=83451 RepID=UPI00193B2140|nr:hypothetical protein [Archangium violaceum]QRK10935.1 hypothetical protein JQX13_13180 [Archangium violaceum]